MVSFDPHHAVLRVVGDEDATTISQRRRPLSAALRATRDVIVDLSELRFADTTLMLDLAVLAQRLRTSGRTLRLRCPQPQVQLLIERMGLHHQPAVTLDVVA
ncbi:MAG: STAS domain-containing protein [Actinomycetota bacterium]|nr:STAS domain-containing protein [Actinomycetota bacterium]